MVSQPPFGTSALQLAPRLRNMNAPDSQMDFKMLCMHGAPFAGTQNRLCKTHPGHYVTWNTDQRAESHQKIQPCCVERRHVPVSNVQIGPASLQGVGKELLTRGWKATGNFSGEETSLAQLGHRHSGHGMGGERPEKDVSSSRPSNRSPWGSQNSLVRLRMGLLLLNKMCAP